jgi:hypothetical protein
MDVYWFGGCIHKHEVMVPIMLLNRILSSVVERRVSQSDTALQFRFTFKQEIKLCQEVPYSQNMSQNCKICHLQCYFFFCPIRKCILCIFTSISYPYTVVFGKGMKKNSRPLTKEINLIFVTS